MSCGVYEVLAEDGYRGHAQGAVFEARIDRRAEIRGLHRGVIRLIRTVTPELQPGSYTFPEGWLAQPTDPSTEAREGLFH